MAAAIRRQHEPQRIIGDLLTAEINEKQAATARTRRTKGSKLDADPGSNLSAD